MKTAWRRTIIQVPRDRESSLSPLLIKKRESSAEGLENIIISLYAKGMTTSDIEQQIHEIYNFTISTATISRITDKITGDIIGWKNSPL